MMKTDTDALEGDARHSSDDAQTSKPPVVLVSCVDGHVPMERKDFLRLCNRIPTLHHILVGYPGMSQECFLTSEGAARELSFSKEWSITRRSFVLAAMCVLSVSSVSPRTITDQDLNCLTSTLALIGGWDVLVELEAKWQKDSPKHIKLERRYHSHAVRPSLDFQSRFEWRILTTGTAFFAQKVDSLQESGFQVMGADGSSFADVNIIHFRRIKAEATTEGGGEGGERGGGGRHGARGVAPATFVGSASNSTSNEAKV